MMGGPRALEMSVTRTSAHLGRDAASYLELMAPFVSAGRRAFEMTSECRLRQVMRFDVFILDRCWRVVAIAGAYPGSVTSGIPIPTQELGHLGFQRGLHQQAHAETADLLKDVRKIAIGRKQLINLVAHGPRGILVSTRA